MDDQSHAALQQLVHHCQSASPPHQRRLDRDWHRPARPAGQREVFPARRVSVRWLEGAPISDPARFRWSLNTRRAGGRRSGGSASKCARRERSLTLPPPMVGQTCRFAPISPPASAAMLAEPWGYARQNIAPLVLVKVWAARQRRPTLVVSSCARPALRSAIPLCFHRRFAYISRLIRTRNSRL